MARIKGKVFVRLGGLVQFEMEFGRNLKRDSVLFVELKNVPRPGTPGYPLTTSRESLTEESRREMSEVIRAHCANPITSSRVIKKTKSKMSLLAGEMLRGRGSCFPLDPKRGKNAPGYCLGKFEVELEGRFRDQVEWDSDDHGRRSPTRVQVLLNEYPRKKISLKDWRTMMAWSEIMRLVASGDEEFGVGLSGDDGAGAERISYEGCIYYVINPHIVEQMKTLRGRVLWMWHLATHEFAHKAEHDHGEMFDAQMSAASSFSADEFGEKIEHIQRVLSGKEMPDLGLSLARNQETPAQLSLDFSGTPEKTLGDYIGPEEDWILQPQLEDLELSPV
jgi:hypothetical protein